jgi:hypothetical protein
MNMFKNALVAFGTTPSPALQFNPDCVVGDTQHFVVDLTSLPSPFPQFPQGKVPRVIVTGGDLFVAPGEYNTFVVPIAQRVTETGFEITARNSDCRINGGFASLSWMAIAELDPQTPASFVPSLRMGVRRPLELQPDCKPGDQVPNDLVIFSTPLPTPPAVLLTATNLNIKPFLTQFLIQADPYGGSRLSYAIIMPLP